MLNKLFIFLQEEEEEVTWQTYKGQLTEKQEKTRDKIIKRNEKVIDAVIYRNLV
jgi:hypothetical protein